MTMLKKTESHFIRCIKSNDACAPQTFDSQLVNKQLLYSGVFEVVKIQQSGLPCRLSHNDFLDRYKCLAPSNIRYKESGRLKSPADLIKWLKSNGYDLPLAQMGVTVIKYFYSRFSCGFKAHLLLTSVNVLQRSRAATS